MSGALPARRAAGIAARDRQGSARFRSSPPRRPRACGWKASSIPNSVIVSGDAGRLQQVFWNLLSNAIKFTPKGGRVQVLLQRVNSHIELSVSDTGIGIPATFLPHVFDRFSQKDASTHRKYGGLGLGLAISKQLVELHGGSIQAKSLGEGEGATFVVTLPLILLGDEEREPQRVHPTAADTGRRHAGSKAGRLARPGRRRRGGCARADSTDTREPGRHRSHGRDPAKRRCDGWRQPSPTSSSATSGCLAWMATSSCG